MTEIIGKFLQGCLYGLFILACASLVYELYLLDQGMSGI